MNDVSGAQDAEIFDADITDIDVSMVREPGKIEIPNKQLKCKVLVEKCDGLYSPSASKRGKFQEDETRKNTQLIGRKEQFRLLDRLFGKGPECTLPGCVFLWGAPASGKSYTLDMVLEGKDLHVLRISCAEILCGRRAFYETLVKQLVSRRTALDPSFKCDSLHSLYSNFYDFLSDDKTDRFLRVVVVVEGAENLRGEYDDILRFLVSLQDIIQSAICVVFISTLPPRQYMPSIMDHSIIPLYFPQYSMDELTQILTMSRSGDGVNSFYDFYIKMIVNMFYYACRDLRKLSRLAKSHWGKFEELSANSQEINTRLWKKLEPQLKAQFFDLNSSVSSMNLTDRPDSHEQIDVQKMAIPLNAKYLLIASYLATHNPPASDKRFFVKAKSGKTKKSRAVFKTDTKGFIRTFELNRLNAIYGSIQEYCDDKAVNKNRNISFMTLLTTLCQNKLIQHLGEDSTGNQKYKCLLDYDTVLEISKSVNFELNNYLFRLI